MRFARFPRWVKRCIVHILVVGLRDFVLFPTQAPDLMLVVRVVLGVICVDNFVTSIVHADSCQCRMCKWLSRDGTRYISGIHGVITTFEA